MAVKAESITKSFPVRDGQLVVLRDVSLTLEQGQSAAIMGPSGSGKSTFLNILGTLELPTSGHVTIAGTNPLELPAQDLARFRNENIGLVFQDHHLLPQCSVLENVLLPTLASHKKAPAVDRAKELLNRVGLSDRLDHRPAELSGGERQRVAIARALVNSPSLVLADEPTGNLDQASADRVGDLLCELQLQEAVSLIVVTHSERLSRRFARRLTIDDGSLLDQ